MSRVVVIGAGISGLATAMFLKHSGHDAVVLEKADHAGGHLRSSLIDGHILDHAANGWLDNEPAVDHLIQISGLSQERIAASPRYDTRWIYADHALHEAPLSPAQLLQTKLLPWWAKLRLFLEPFILRGPPSQTVGEFARRRLGRMVAERLIAPMVAGIYATDPDQLSLRAAFPRLWEMEQRHGSLLMAALRRDKNAHPRGHLETLRRGAGHLSEHLVAELGACLHLNTAATRLVRSESGWQVETETRSFTADAVVLACPAPAQAKLIESFLPAAADALRAVHYAPAAVVVTGWTDDAFAHSPRGFGVLLSQDSTIPDAEAVLGTVFSTAVFPNQAPDQRHLARTILGGTRFPTVLTLDDQELVRQAQQALSTFLGPMTGQLDIARVFRHPLGIPLYGPHHQSLLDRIDGAQGTHDGLYFIGNHLRGVGVKDCIRAAEQVTALITGA